MALSIAEQTALIAYNFGVGNTDRHIDKHGGINVSELPEETQGYIQKIQERVDKGMSLTDAQIEVESSNNPDAISDKGAVGLMQIKPSTATDPGFSNNEELTNLSMQLSGLSEEEVIKKLKDPKVNRGLGEAYRIALTNKYTKELPSEEKPLAIVDSSSSPKKVSLVDIFNAPEERSSVDVVDESKKPIVAGTETPKKVSLVDIFNAPEKPTVGVTDTGDVTATEDVTDTVVGIFNEPEEKESLEKVGSDFAHISTNRRVQFGAARERMVLGLLWDMGKGASRALLDGDKTYAEAMDEVHEEELENVYKEFPEFRGVSMYDEDAAMIAGRIGVAFVDPVSYMLPWGKAARMGYLTTMGLGGTYAAAYTAGLGHVERDEQLTSPEMIGTSFVLGSALGAGVLGATRYYTRLKANSVGTEAEKLNTSRTVDESARESQETVETLNRTGNEPSVKVVDENASDPIESINSSNAATRENWEEVPINSSPSKLANASRESFDGHSTPEMNQSDVDNINKAREEIIKATGSKFIPDPKVAIGLSDDLHIIIRQSKQLEEVKKQLKKKQSKKKRGALKKLKLELEESLATVRLRDLKNTVNRALDGQDLAELTFDMAAKEGWLTHGVMQGLIREGTRPIFGAAGGFVASQFFADTEDGYGSTLAWTIGGAALMGWHKKIQTAPISSFDKETGEMIIHDQWRKWVSYSNLKFLTASSVSTKLDSLGGIGKVVGNLLFDRPGGGTRSIESNAYEATLSWNKGLRDILHESQADEKVLLVAGEVLNKFVRGASVTDSTEEVLKRITVGYKGLDENQVVEVNRIVPLLEKQRDDLALSIDQLGIPFTRLDDYGMAQLYNLDAIRENPERFKQILANNLPKYKTSSEADKKRGVEAIYNKMFPRNSGQIDMKAHYARDSIVSPNYKFRPLMNHFEKERYIKDFETRRLLGEEGFINLNARDVFQTYAKKTIEIREFAKVFGPNSERLKEAFRIVDASFKNAGFSKTDDQYIKYKKYMRDSVNAYFGKYGDFATPYASLVNPVSQMMVALSNMTFLTRVGIPSLNDFVQPFKATSIKAGAKALGYRLSKSEASPSRRVGLKYNDDFEDELRALLVRSNDSLSTYTDFINKRQREFFKLVQLKRITEQAGRFAFDTGAFRAFDVAKILARNKPLGKPLQREIKEMGLQNQDLFYLAKFKNANEAFDDTIGKQILTRAGMKVMDRDRLVPKVGNRLLFTQHRDPVVRQLGQFASWAQAKTAQTNAMIKRIEDGDMKLFMRIMGANVIAGSAVNFLRELARPSFDAEEDLDPLKFAQRTIEMGGDVNNWVITRAGSAFKYNLKQGNSLAESVSPSWSWGAGLVEAVGHAYTNLVEDGDIEGAWEDIISVMPLVGEFNKQAKRFGLWHWEDKPKDAKLYTSPALYAKGGEVLNVPNVPIEPDERIDKMTGLPYDQQAGVAFVDEEDQLRRLGFGSGGSPVQSTLEQIAKTAYGFSLEDFQNHTRESIEITNKAVDMGFLPERERVVFSEPEEIGGQRMTPFQSGDAFNAINHASFARKNKDAPIKGLNLKGTVGPMLQAKEVIQSFLTRDAAEDAANNSAGINSAKQNASTEEAMLNLIIARNKKIRDGKPLETGKDLIFTPEEITERSGSLYKTLKSIQRSNIFREQKVLGGVAARIGSKLLKGSPRLKQSVQELRDEATALRFGDPDTSYRGQHQPRGDTDESPIRLDNLTRSTKGEVAGYPDDFYSPQGRRIYTSLKSDADQESYNTILRVKDNPEAEVTIYRGVPKDEKINTINKGDFVTLSPRYAELHAASGYGPRGEDAGKVISKRVKVKDIFHDANDVNEFGYFPQTNFKPAKPLDIGVDEFLIDGSKIKNYSVKDLEELDSLIPTATAGTKKADELIMAPVKEGTKSGVRLNLNSKIKGSSKPALSKLQTIHKNNYRGKALSYAPYVTLTDVMFSVNQKGRVGIASKIKNLDVPEAQNKFPAMSVDGLYTTKRNVLKEIDDSVVEIGINPVGQHLFIDFKTGQAVKSADIATIIGDRVYAKGVEYWKKAKAPKPLKASDGTIIESTVRYKHRKGGEIQFNEGGEASDSEFIVRGPGQTVTTRSGVPVSSIVNTRPTSATPESSPVQGSVEQMISSGALNASPTFGGVNLLNPRNLSDAQLAAQQQEQQEIARARQENEARLIAEGRAAGERIRAEQAQLQVPDEAEFWADTEESLNWENPYPARPDWSAGQRFDYTQEGSGIAGGGNFPLTFDRIFSSQWKQDIAGLSAEESQLYSGNASSFASALTPDYWKSTGVPQEAIDASKFNWELKNYRDRHRVMTTNKEYVRAFSLLGIDPNTLTSPEALAAISPDKKAAVFDIVQRELQRKNQRSKPFGFGDAMGIAGAVAGAVVLGAAAAGAAGVGPAAGGAAFKNVGVGKFLNTLQKLGLKVGISNLPRAIQYGMAGRNIASVFGGSDKGVSSDYSGVGGDLLGHAISAERNRFFTGGLSEEVLSELEASGDARLIKAAGEERSLQKQRGALEKKYEEEITRTQETGMSSSDVERQNIFAERKSREQPQTNVEFETDPLQNLGFTGSKDTTETFVSPLEEPQEPAVGWGAVDALLASPEKMAEAQERAEERQTNEAEALREAAASWVNPMFNPDRDKGGYTRYDHTKRGSGLNTARTFADGARAFHIYNALQKNQPGYTHAQNARNNLTRMGVTVDTATDEQLFDALDLALRSAQWKNKRPKRGFGIKEALGMALQVGSFFVPTAGPIFTTAMRTGVQGALGGTGAFLQGEKPGGVVLGALTPMVGSFALSELQKGKWLTPSQAAAAKKVGIGAGATGITAEVIDRYTEEQKDLSKATGLG